MPFVLGLPLETPLDRKSVEWVELVGPASLLLLGKNTNKSADALAGSYGLFAFSCIFWLGTMFLLAWLLLKKRDVRA